MFGGLQAARVILAIWIRDEKISTILLDKFLYHDKECPVMKKCICKKCNFQWLPRVENPLACPNCKCRSWNQKPKAKP